MWIHLEPQGLTGTPNTRFEAFLHVVLHLMLAAIAEDATSEHDVESKLSFVRFALKGVAPGTYSPTLLNLLVRMLDNEDIRGCHSKIRLILQRLRQHRPSLYRSSVMRLEGSVGGAAQSLLFERAGTESPQTPLAEDSEAKQRQIREAKKRQALDRQAKVMAQFQQQQENFLKNQESINWGEDDLAEVDSITAGATEEHRKLWKYPAGNCILCQEETNDTRLYGTFAMIIESKILRQTDLGDSETVEEVLSTPLNLDESAR